MQRNRNALIAGGTVLIEDWKEPEDLLAALMFELERVSLTKHSVAEETRQWLEGMTYNDLTREEMSAELISDMIVSLNEMAPNGLYFGHPAGNRAVIGWFPTETF